MHQLARAPGQVARLAGGDAVAAPLRLAHHREGGVLVDPEDLERVGNEKDIHGPAMLPESAPASTAPPSRPCSPWALVPRSPPCCPAPPPSCSAGSGSRPRRPRCGAFGQTAF